MIGKILSIITLVVKVKKTNFNFESIYFIWNWLKFVPSMNAKCKTEWWNKTSVTGGLNTHTRMIE